MVPQVDAVVKAGGARRRGEFRAYHFCDSSLKWIENDMKAIRTIVVAIAVMLFIIMMCVGLRQIPYLLAKRDTYALAYQLGYTDDKQIIAWRRCTPSIALDAIFSPQCAVVIGYYTNTSSDQIQSRIDQLGFVALEGIARGEDLAYELRPEDFTINGVTSRNIGLQQLHFPVGPLWEMKDKSYRTIEVHYYDITHHSDEIYMLNGKRISENIAIVILWENR